MSDFINTPVGFTKCFVCEGELKGTMWYHNLCWDWHKPAIRRVRTALAEIPLAIPEHQHYRYIRRIYIGKEVDETTNQT